MTEYIILVYDDDCNAWGVLNHDTKVSASSARRAIAAVTNTQGQYVAVPARSWKPLLVTIEQTTKVTIS